MNKKILEIAKECGALDLGISPLDLTKGVISFVQFTEEQLELFALRMKQEALLEAAKEFVSFGANNVMAEYSTEYFAIARELRRMAESLGKGNDER